MSYGASAAANAPPPPLLVPQPITLPTSPISICYPTSRYSTGANLDHPALAGRLVGGYDVVDHDADPRAQGSAAADAVFGHGTHVAGIVALVVTEARMLPLRTLAPDGSGDLWTQMVALRDAVAQGAQVINRSFSVNITAAVGANQP